MPKSLVPALLALVLALSAAADEKPRAVGEKVPDVGRLRDLRGNGRNLYSFKDHKAVVVAFLGTDCPISNLYLPGLVALEKKYRAKGVQFLAVYPNQGEDLDQIAIHSYDRDIPFPVLKDAESKLAAAAGATRV